MPVWYLVPDGVVQYIEKRGLYRERPRRPIPDAGRGPAASPPSTDGHPPTTDPHFQEVPR
jgi:nicotinate-nucleotide adenylyltransferase